ncbi:hypothetical protein DI09_67p160 [Mitosporidium daphniae]|uniref:Uncharacterized protein n=1 Tax=Mitosporidium daphniae TaxID=1485682 RepID=A0A098VN98_9MICR|nr:uncharacterized protein DI09_67p160 [Mitosporidium daphniae]KGG50528.1 hypothetical protein DI09_67p160 [Mitosporidium daphniae]|eukprot:XP_013236955.1 uncharacterized protein DI09_67p160 [Mitosporidium daphniae]
MEADPNSLLKLDVSSNYLIFYRVKRRKKYDEIPFGVLRFRGAWSASIYPLYLFDVISLIIESKETHNKIQTEARICDFFETKLPPYLHYPLVMTFTGMGLAEFIQKYRPAAINPKSTNSDATIAKEKATKELLQVNSQYKQTRTLLSDTERLCLPPDLSIFRSLKTGILKENESLSDLLEVPSSFLQSATSIFADIIAESIDKGQRLPIDEILQGNICHQIL